MLPGLGFAPCSTELLSPSCFFRRNTEFGFPFIPSHPSSSSPFPPLHHFRSCLASAAFTDQSYEVRVCTHRTCRKSGSLQTLEQLQGLSSPNISVVSCGCLGRCGSGPNLVVLPAEVFVSHCNTPAHAARLLALQCGLTDPENNLKSLALRRKGNEAFESGEITEAEILFSQAIELRPSGGLHFLYSNRSAARLAKQDTEGALQDALHAACLSPKWHVPLLRQGEVYMAIGDYQAAEKAFKKALALDPSLRRSKSYQRKVRELEMLSMPANK